MHAVPHHLPSGKYQLLFKEKFVSIYHSAEDGWLYVRWKGERSKEGLMQGAREMVRLVKETGSHKMINDSTFGDKPLPEAVEWVTKVLAPQLANAGLEYLAWIYDDNNQFGPTADAILANSTSDIIALVFDKMELAEHWLRSVR